MSDPVKPSLLLEAEDGWMEVTVEPGPTGTLTLSLRGVHGVRAGKFHQHVDLGAEQREQLAAALLAGTRSKVVPR